LLLNGIEGVHEIGLAAPDPAPQVETDLGLDLVTSPATPTANQPAPPFQPTCEQALVKVLQQPHSLFLGGIVGEVLPLQVGLVTLPGSGHGGLISIPCGDERKTLPTAPVPCNGVTQAPEPYGEAAICFRPAGIAVYWPTFQIGMENDLWNHPS
jgi:hypothetical protein